VGYFFGRKLQQELNIPIGLLHTSWGGTPAEAWTSAPALAGDKALNHVVGDWQKRMERFPAELAKYEKDLITWQASANAAKAAGKPAPNKPRPPAGDDSPHKPSSLFNGMISPLLPYTVRGAIWYQGESNAGRHAEYHQLMTLMIGDWRQHFGQGDFSFYIVQLANFKARADQPTDSDWAKLRDAQYLTTTTVKNTGLATIIDIGDEKDIHPKNKQDVGLRLALNALAKDYGKDITYSGPVFKSLAIEGNKAVLSFDHIGGGLTMSQGDKLSGFAIAGADGVFVWGDAAIVGDTVVVSAATVAKPTAVRYAWADNPDCNFANKAGLPAVPFKSDR
jgi:sialate O-acetylesterase